MEAVFVANLNSRQSRTLASRAHALLRRAGVDIVASHVGKNGDEVAAFAKGAIRAGTSHVIVGGGDGTMTKAVGAFAHERAVLGVLPFGTGNSFALSLGIPTDLAAAVDIVAGGRVGAVDLGVVNGSHFANFATIGLASRIARNTPTELKAMLGPLAYAVSGVGPFVSSRPFKCTIKWDGQKAKIATHQIIVASGQCFGKRALLPGKTIVDGELAFFTTTGAGLLDVARAYVSLYRGTNTLLADAFYFSAPKIEIETEPRQKLDVDGGSFGKTPATFSIDARALNVFVPPTFDCA